MLWMLWQLMCFVEDDTHARIPQHINVDVCLQMRHNGGMMQERRHGEYGFARLLVDLPKTPWCFVRFNLLCTEKQCVQVVRICALLRMRQGQQHVSVHHIHVPTSADSSDVAGL